MEKTKPFFSVIIPTFNRAILVKRAVRSVLNQKFQDFEIIIIDDGSTDYTYKEIRQFGNCDIRYIKHNKKRGGAVARNTGVENASGGYIAFLDSDDEAFPEWLEKSYSKIQELPTTWGVLYPRYLIKNDVTGVNYIKTENSREGYIYEKLLRGEGIPLGTSGAILKKKIFKNIGGFDCNLSGFHDVDLWYRLAKNHTFHFLNEPLILFHHHKSHRLMGDLEKRRKASEIFLSKWKNEIERIGGKQAYLKRINRFNKLSNFSLIRQELEANGKSSAIRLLINSFDIRIFSFSVFLKNLLIIAIGPFYYDHFKRLRGEIKRIFKY